MKKLLFVMFIVSFMLTGVMTSYASQGDARDNGKVKVENTQPQKAISTPIWVKKKDKTQDSASKSQLVALLLAVFLGTLGIHRFYLGYTTRGIVMLLLATVGGIFFGIGTLVAFVMSIIDIINIATGKLKPKDGSEYNPTL